MRYYEIQPPNGEKFFVTNARELRNLPEGTRCTAIITERDGTPVEHIELPVKNGKVEFPDNKQKPKLTPH